MTTTYDYIVVGAGSAGCVLAGRLSADPSVNVLLLEAGGRNDSFMVRMPKGIARLVGSAEHTWQYSIAQKRTQDSSTPETWIRGKGLGGSSAINGMIWSRGQPEDYQAWEQQGCPGWGWSEMKAVFRALEDSRSEGGAVTVTLGGDYRYPLTEDLIRAGEALGLQRTPDLNAVSGERVGYYSHNIRKGKRVSSAEAFLAPAAGRSNLRVVTHAEVQRVLFNGDRATGVDVRVGGKLQRFDCRREIILSAGALESPRLLQLSGIGPQDVLERAGVPVVHASPAVGRHMREHLSFAMPFRMRTAAGNHRAFHGLGLLRSMLDYQFRRRGPLATGPFEVGAFVRVGEQAGPPNLQLYMGGYAFALSDDNHPVPLGSVDRQPGLSIYGQLLQLTSEGQVSITSADPAARAEIVPNWLSTEEDCRMAIDTVRYIRNYAAQQPLAGHVAAELLPGAHCRSDEQILDAFRRLSTSGLHGTGTCRMGPDAAAVVDERLRVRGVEGLRVADCSVIPVLISGNTNAPAMAVGWRAADLILEDQARLSGFDRVGSIDS